VATAPVAEANLTGIKVAFVKVNKIVMAAHGKHAAVRAELDVTDRLLAAPDNVNLLQRVSIDDLKRAVPQTHRHPLPRPR
jgi:hypothetical protein